MEQKLANISDVADKSFDFVIVGGGVAGCVLAARLSENPNVTVALLEAGNAHIDDPLITTPDGWMRQLFNPEYDYVYRTVPQTNSKNAVTTPDGAPDPSFYWTRGKGLGGSSVINFLMWTRPQREEIDAIEALGNEGWNWARYFEASKKVESFHPITHTNDSEYANKYNAESVGSNGPLPISFNRTVSGAESHFQKALGAFGVNTLDDALGGAHAGTFKCASTVDPRTGTRSTSASAYLFPVLDRPNLKVLTGATVRRLLTTKQTDVVATGAEFAHGEQIYKVNASKEVILSAGTVKSPHILELSGIGSRATLEAASIPVQVDLPGVGENLQDHIIFCGNMWQMKDGHSFATSDSLTAPELQAKLKELYGGLGGPVSLTTTGVSFLPLQTVSDRAAELISTAERAIAAKADKLPPGLKEQYDAQLALYKSPNVPSVEIIVFPFNPHPSGQPVPLIGVFPVLSHPLSRGSIHATTADPAVEPAIDPNYLGEEVDFEILLDAAKFVLKVAGTGPWQAVAERELFPGAAGATEEGLRDFVRSFISTVWHACGTCSMLPRNKGGVVDASLKVYGTKNVRVADLSTLPLMTAAHTQSTVFATAEQASDIIKKEYGF